MPFTPHVIIITAAATHSDSVSVCVMDTAFPSSNGASFVECAKGIPYEDVKQVMSSHNPANCHGMCLRIR